MLRRVLILLFCCSLCGFAQSKHPFTFEDMMQLKRIGEPIVSPDSKWAGFTAVDVNLDENTRSRICGSFPSAAARHVVSLPPPVPGKIAFASRPMASASCSRRHAMALRRSGCRTSTPASGTLTGEPRKVTSISTEASGGTLVARRQEHPVRLLGLSRLQGRCVQ